jgi:hypothetical protein
MKKFLVVAIFVFSLFGFNGSLDAASLIEDLKTFEQSLSEWVANFDKLDQRLSNLEDDEEAEDKQLADFNQSLSNIEQLLADLNAKIDKVEKMRSASGIRDTLKEFEGTLNVFKRRFSEMAKRLEDQEVKTAVLGKIYDTAQRPLETLMQAIDEQKDVINNMANRLDEQGKALLAIEGGFRQILPAESPARGMEAAVLAFKQKQKEIEEINARLSRLESGTIVRKTEETVEKKPEAEIMEKVVVSETPTEGAKAPTEKPSEMKGFTNIGGGFFIKNLKLKPFGSSTYISGEITNKSDRDYSIVDFRIQAYSEENDLLGDHSFSIKGFKRDGTKTFEEVIAGAASERIAKYFIFPAEMPLGSDMGEGTVEMIGKKLQVAMAETAVKQPQIEEGKTTAKKAWEIAKELEGFENIGNGFFIRNVSFSGFGSSSTVTGEIKNNSKNDLYLASFVMKVYSKDFGMITSFDFSVRRLKSGGIKTFEEIVTGVPPVDISRYEVVFKSSY